jgi:hypothetical protein
MFLVLPAVLFLAGCAGSNPPPPPPPGLHLYVGNGNTTGVILQYGLPIANASAAQTLVATPPRIFAVAVDPSGANLVAGTLTGQIVFWTLPITSASTPATAFPNGAGPSVGQIWFDGGTMYATTTSNKVNVFTAPFTSSSTPTTISIPELSLTYGVARDSSTATTYVSNTQDPTATGGNLVAISGSGVISTPPIAGRSYRQLALFGGLLLVASDSSIVTRVDAYTLPLTTASAPAFSITTGIDRPLSIAADKRALYVGNRNGQNVVEYTAPFSSASAPVVSLPIGTTPGTFDVTAIAVGQ